MRYAQALEYWLAKIRRDCEAAGLPLDAVHEGWPDDTTVPRVTAPRSSLVATHERPEPDPLTATAIVERLSVTVPTADGGVRVDFERIRFAQPVHGTVWHTRRCRPGIGWAWDVESTTKASDDAA
jgi:hypothetical protein